MKKLTIWQLVTTVLTLSVFFITLNLTGDKETATATALVTAAAAALAAAFAAVFLSAAAALAAAFVAAALVALAAAVSAALAAVAAVAVVASELKISKQEAVTRYLLQFMIILAPMLFYVFKT